MIRLWSAARRAAAPWLDAAIAVAENPAFSTNRYAASRSAPLANARVIRPAGCPAGCRPQADHRADRWGRIYAGLPGQGVRADLQQGSWQRCACDDGVGAHTSRRTARRVGPRMVDALDEVGTRVCHRQAAHRTTRVRSLA